MKPATEAESTWHQVSAKKAQLCQLDIWGINPGGGGQPIHADSQKQTILSIPVPSTQRQVQEFLGCARFCRLWCHG